MKILRKFVFVFFAVLLIGVILTWSEPAQFMGSSEVKVYPEISGVEPTEGVNIEPKSLVVWSSIEKEELDPHGEIRRGEEDVKVYIFRCKTCTLFIFLDSLDDQWKEDFDRSEKVYFYGDHLGKRIWVAASPGINAVDFLARLSKF